MASHISNENSVSSIQGSKSSIVATPSTTTLLYQLFTALVEGKLTEPPRSIRHKPFEFLKSIDLRNIGLTLDDIPYDFGWKLVPFGEKVVCLSSEKIGETIEKLGAKDKVFLHEFRSDDMWEVEPCSFGLFPDPETGAETGPEHFDSVYTDDLGEDLKDDSNESGGSGEQLETSLTEFVQTTPIPQTGEKRKRYKMEARRTRTPRTRAPSRPKIALTKETTTTPTQPQFTPRPTRKSSRIAFQATPRSVAQSTPVIEEISSSSSTSSSENTSFKQGTPVFSESSEEKPLPEPSSEPALPISRPATTLPSERPSTTETPSKRKAVCKKASNQGPVDDSPTAPLPKKAKTSASPAPHPKLSQFLQRRIVRGKIVKISYFEEQGLGVFLQKLRAQGWFELFTNTQLGCSAHELAEFYANYSVTNGVVTSTVNGKKLRFNAKTLGEILGIPSTGFDVYVREDKKVLGAARLLELSRKLSQQTGLQTPQSVKKGDMTSIHQLIFWFVIKNVIPRGQGRNLADAMDQCLMDLMDREEQINLPALMIRHIARIANISRGHDLGYGFLLTCVFEHFGVELQKRVGAQFIDEIGSNTLMGCGYNLVEGSASEQGTNTPRPPVPGSSSANVEAVQEHHSRLDAELTAVKAALDEEKALNSKRHEDILALLTSLSAKLSPPAP